MAIVIDGSANTIGGLAVGGLPNGVVDSDMIASSVPLGISGYDTWSLTAQKNWSGTNTFDSDFTRNTAVPSIGSAMTMSSGVFTFPTTGIWEVFIQGKVLDSTPNAWTEVEIHKSTNGGSNWTSIAQGDDSIFDDGSNNVYCNPSVKAPVDVTSTSDVKIKLQIHNEQGALVAGGADVLHTFAIFKRIGDT